MRKNRIFSLVCALAFSVSALVSCTDNNSGSSENKEGSSLAAQSSSDTSKPEYKAKYKLSNPKSSAVTAKLYDYICDNFGKKMLSAQQESTWVMGSNYEIDYIKEKTGKEPAIRGLDYMNNDFSGVNERAVDWWMEGGIVTICWHTGVESSGYDEAMKERPDFDKLLTEGTEENKKMLESWDKAAEALKQLKEMNIPVLWRPFHEFDGGWFWWSKGGSENFKKLWRMMYDRYTNKFGLDNLIWVLGYSGEVNDDWYVGDDYCDIIGSDTYDGTTNKKAWERLRKVTDSGKPIAFHECGDIPSIEEFKKDKDIWSFFMCWHTDHIMDNDVKNLKAVYNSDTVITRDELPDLKLS